MRRMGLAGLLVVSLLTTPLTSTTGEKQLMDIKDLAGTWQGWVTTESGQARLMMTIKEDGSYEASSQFGTLTVGQYYLEDGKLRYRSSRSVGRATLSEESGKTLLIVIPESAPRNTGKTEYERVK